KDKFIVDNAFSDELGSEASASLSAIPLQVGVSMQSSEIEIGLGMGPYLMLSSIYYGRLSEGRRIELGITFFGSYRFALNEDIYIGPELRLLYLSYRGIISIMPSLSIRLETLRY
ncbi:MAG: hypothetical protein MUO34_06170, partial [Ignavibacteriaceae bacterium]|nr:hypothetical protein [Ignavibacteriaceae bacterium]